MSEKNDKSEESNNDHITLPSQSGGNSLLRSSVLRPSVLRSSVLSSAANHTEHISASAESDKEFTKANDEMGNNPFMKEQKDDENEEAGAVGGEIVKNNDVEASEKKKSEDDDEIDERPDPLTLLRKNGLERANLFAAAKNSIPRVEKSGFVFGQNVHERVVVDNMNTDSTTKQENSNSSAPTSGELLFSSVIQNAAKSNEGDTAKEETEVKSLTDVAREYEESRAQKRKYEEVETFTGEENEVNIIDINCKLFAFVNSNWEERGRGSLRLNDSKNEQECSRVVFRTSGNLRLLLNTKVWAGMVAERPSQKSLRLTAMDNTGKIKIFLLMARPVDINQLHKSLVERIDMRKTSHPEEYHTAVADNNGEATKHCDSVELDEVVKAASTAEPEHEDSTEPSPKKSLVTDSTN